MVHDFVDSVDLTGDVGSCTCDFYRSCSSLSEKTEKEEKRDRLQRTYDRLDKVMLDDLIRLVVYLTVVSVAAERAVDIIKRTVIAKYDLSTMSGGIYQILSGLFGGIVVMIDEPKFDFITSNHWLLIVILGLGASGGSGAWNTILSILKELSIPKKLEDKT